jgi:hypothetical protein
MLLSGLITNMCIYKIRIRGLKEAKFHTQWTFEKAFEKKRAQEAESKRRTFSQHNYRKKDM